MTEINRQLRRLSQLGHLSCLSGLSSLSGLSGIRVRLNGFRDGRSNTYNGVLSRSIHIPSLDPDPTVVNYTSALTVAPGSTVYSAIQPTGVFHLGNYLGAVRSWVDISETAPSDSTLIFGVADLHALTSPRPANQLRETRRQAIASILSTGIDPDRCIVYYQSAVPQHSELCWILSTVSGMGYLNRMTQWKSKSNLNSSSSITTASKDILSNLRLGLFAYPVLQAADVLLYQADLVPVGEDQAQHLELCRHIATTFNHHYPAGPTDTDSVFPLPRTLLAPFKKVASLRDPSKKMSKSDPNKASCIYLTDSPEVIRTKIFKALTDSIPGPITFDPDNRPAIANLLSIVGGLYRIDAQSVLDKFMSHVTDHRQLKEVISDLIIESLSPVRLQYEKLNKDPGYLDKISTAGAEKATVLANKTMTKVRDAVGLN